MPTISTVLIANRGEIAVRILRTCHAMGLATVAIYSDADREAPYVRLADRAVAIGAPEARASYLAIEKIVAAARRAGADAVHPGFGFLAENADFAAACQAAGLTFIGPSPAVIRELGSKRAAKAIAVRAGVPIVPSWEPGDPAIAYPVLLKASAGGGGKGMRIVRAAAELAPALESARREAAAAFGDDTMLIERYVEAPRHVEIQILGDHHGNLVHLGERECSIQRRHQKIVEESPSPALDPALRAKMGDAAVAIGRAVGYQNAGTVEFILAPDRAFYFLEVNTRLQVEHPVTEMCSGIDLVREQIRIARGEPLGLAQAAITSRGHAIEVRLYAEDADAGFLPTTGRLLDWQVPALPGLRVDAGVETGSEIGIHYDPMLAKVIAHGATRAEAIDLLCRGLERLCASGLTTNREFLVRVLRHPAFGRGETDTHFLERHAAALARPPADPTERERALAAALLAGFAARGAARTVLPHLEAGFRNNPSDSHVSFRLGGVDQTITYRNVGGGALILGTGDSETAVHLLGRDGAALAFELGGVRQACRVVSDGLRHFVHDGGRCHVVDELPRFPAKLRAALAGGFAAPMPGKVVKILVAAGDAVVAGQTLVVLEAMKMEHAVKAGRAGVVESLRVGEGEQVEGGAILVVVTDTDGAPARPAAVL